MSRKNIIESVDPSAVPFALDQCEFLKMEEDHSLQLQVKNAQKTLSESKRAHSSSALSRKESAKNSTAKYREKKKQQLTVLEQTVKQMQAEINEVETGIQSMKKKIMIALETLTKINQLSNNQNIEIYNELEVLLGKNDHCKLQAEWKSHPIMIDEQKINLLLDTLKYRIGASGRQRQSKLTYHFKSIVNTLFPALYRYLVLSCVHEIDFFEKEPGSKKWDWTQQLLKKLELKPSQMSQIQNDYSRRLNNVYSQTIEGVKKLNSVKDKLRQEGIKVQKVQENLRQTISAAQCAHWTIFSQKNKYRQELLLDAPFFHDNPKILEQEDEAIFIEGLQGRKRTKLQN